CGARWSRIRRLARSRGRKLHRRVRLRATVPGAEFTDSVAARDGGRQAPDGSATPGQPPLRAGGFGGLAQFLHGRAEAIWVLEHPAAGDEHVRTGGRGTPDRGRTDAAVDLDVD